MWAALVATVASSRSPSRALGRLGGWGLGALGLGLLLHWVPLFHIVPLEAARLAAERDRFDAARYVDELWDGPLLAATRAAVDAADLVAALRQDFAGASKRLGHRVGLGGSVFFLVSGEGRVARITEDAIEIELREVKPAQRPGQSDALPIVSIETGPVFGSAVRDGSALLDVSDFANSQEFNAVASEINRRVEQRVLPQLTAHAVVGRAVRFVGGVELSDSGSPPARLAVVPVVVQWP